MWLLDVSTFELKNFFGQNVATEQPYAILSHSWEKEEGTFQDMQDLKKAFKEAGVWKIKMTCWQAKLDSLKYAWVDTCCIDKTSSAELQEAINSMFEWYANATWCYAYLADVSDSTVTESRWFTRGWYVVHMRCNFNDLYRGHAASLVVVHRTLQELIVPKDVSLYDKQWLFLGTRLDHADSISTRTGIEWFMLRATRITRPQSEHKPLENASPS